MNQDNYIRDIENAVLHASGTNTASVADTTDSVRGAGDSKQPRVVEDRVDTNTFSQEEAQHRGVEDVARSQGWVPADEFSGDPSEWVSAETFVERGRLFKVIHKKNQENARYQAELDTMKKAVFDMKDMLNKAQEHALVRAREEVKAEKVAALRAGEMEKVVSLDEELQKLDSKEKEYKEKLEKEKEAFKPVDNKEDEFANYYKTWVPDNGWYLDNKDMRADADMYGRNYVASNPDATPEDTFKYVNDKIRRDYPEKFQPHDTRRGGDVIPRKTTTVNRERDSNKVDIKKLTPEQLEVATRFQELGVMTIEEAAKQWAAMK